MHQMIIVAMGIKDIMILQNVFAVLNAFVSELPRLWLKREYYISTLAMTDS